MSEPKDQFRGWFIPVSIVEHYEAGDLSEAEVLLLSKIDALQDKKRGGCWASNQFLAEWWGNRTDTWVSKTVSKFQKLKLVKVTQFGDGARIITTTFSLNSTSSCRLNASSTKLAKAKRYEAVNGHRSSRFDLKAPSHISEPPDLSPAVRSYAQFTQGRKFHIRSRSPKVIYAKGAQKGGWSRQTLLQWQRRYDELCESFGENKIKTIMRFFLHNYNHEFAPDARTLLAFAEKFDRIEKWYRRQLKERGEDGMDEPSIESEGEEEESVREVSEAEARKLITEVDEFDHEDDSGE